MNKFEISPALSIGEMHPLFKPLLWVSTAISDDEARYILTRIHIEKEELVYHIVATDGKRLHVSTYDPGMLDSDFDGLEIGDYEVIAKSAKLLVIALVEDAGKYPDWRWHFPQNSDRWIMHSELIFAKTTSQICMMTGKLVATDFLVDAIGFGHGYKKSEAVFVRFGADPAGGMGVLIEHELGKALVMAVCFRDDDDDATAKPKTEAEATPEMESFAKHFESENERE